MHVKIIDLDGKCAFTLEENRGIFFSDCNYERCFLKKFFNNHSQSCSIIPCITSTW